MVLRAADGDARRDRAVNTLIRKEGGSDGIIFKATSALKILTFNLGLQAIPLPAGRQIPLVPHVERRLQAMPAALLECGADIIALQEVFTPRVRSFLLRTMNASHPHALWGPGRWSLLGHGLLVLSRWPIADSWFSPFPEKSFLLQRVWQRGVLFTEFEVPGIGALSVVNVHLSPDPPYMQPDDTLSRGYRVHEIDLLLAEASKGRADTILAGDFNAGPEICWHDHQRLLDGGYGDVFAAVHGHKTYAPTYDRANVLARNGPYRHWPGQRADHILLRTGSRLKPLSAEIVFREPLPTYGNNPSCPLSDHYGVLVTLAC